MRRYRNKLNVRQINGLPPGRHSDGAGLYLRVKPNGLRSWVLINISCGHRREMGLGAADDVSLAEARERAAVARRAFAEGRDPIAERKAEREARRPQPPKITFGRYAKELIGEIEAGFRNEKHRMQWRSTLATHAKRLADKALDQIDTDDVVAVLRPIWTKTPETASRVRGRIERVLDAARVAGHRSGENPARWKGHLELILPRQRKSAPKHFPALPFSLIADLMHELAERPATSARALEFTILTAARSGETIGMTWREVHLDQRLWTVPMTRMKAGAEHKVPLSDRACKILTALLPEPYDPKALAFREDRGGKMSNMAMSMLLRFRNLKEPGRYSDGDGLILALSGPGRGSWVVRVQTAGKRRDVGLGSLDNLSLAEAREAATALRKQVGLDPVAERKRERLVIPTSGRRLSGCTRNTRQPGRTASIRRNGSRLWRRTCSRNWVTSSFPKSKVQRFATYWRRFG